MADVRRYLATLLLGGLLVLAVTDRGEATHDSVLEELEQAMAVSKTRARAAARAMPSVCSIRAFGKKRDGYGAGVFVSADGHLLTALHVVEGATALSIVLNDGHEVPGKVIASEKSLDLALVRALEPGRAFVPATFGRDTALELGEELLALGNPYGVGVTVTRGVLSARDRRHVVKDNAAPLLQTDAAINPGSSGGALVNVRGEVVGLVTAILTKSGGHEGIGFAVPARVLMRALPALRAGRPVGRPWIGLHVVEVKDSLKVTGTTPGSPAAAAGFLPGDRLIMLNEGAAATIAQLREAVESTGVGGKMSVKIRRGEETSSFDLEVFSRP